MIIPTSLLAKIIGSPDTTTANRIHCFAMCFAAQILRFGSDRSACRSQATVTVAAGHHWKWPGTTEITNPAVISRVGC